MFSNKDGVSADSVFNNSRSTLFDSKRLFFRQMNIFGKIRNNFDKLQVNRRSFVIKGFQNI